MAISFSFRPKIIDALPGYNQQRLLRDLSAGVTVAVVALPLAMAFAIASGLKPEAGIFTAIIGGFLISLLGGSRVQIGGPAGAFIVIVYGIVHDHGVGGLILATTLSGIMLFLMGVFKAGTLVRYIPTSVIIGFTNGIAVLIALSQIKDFFGFQIADMPGDFFGIMASLWTHRATISGTTSALALASLALIVLWEFGLPKLARRNVNHRFWRILASLPGSIVALVLATLAATLWHLPVETIGSRFGGIPQSLPTLALPTFHWEAMRTLIMPTVTLALLGAIESLLCARVADDMIGDQHDPNQELMAQGVANFVAPLMGGMPATGTIARTVTNLKAGATSPVAGIIHAAVLLVVVLVAAPLASAIPLGALAAILMFVAWNMGQWRAFAHLRHLTLPYRVSLLSVFGLTVIFDLTVAVQFGIVIACLTFIYRMAQLSTAEQVINDPQQGLDVWQLSGVLFFGSTDLAEARLHALPQRALILDFEHVSYMDSTGADAVINLLRTCRNQGVQLLLCGLRKQPLDMAQRRRLLAPTDGAPHYPDLPRALDAFETPR